MQKDEIEKTLLALAKTIGEHEAAAVKAALALEQAESDLRDVEATLLVEGKVEGKNQETRDAHLHQITAEFRGKVRERKREHALAAGRLRAVLATFSAYRNIAKMYHNGEQ